MLQTMEIQDVTRLTTLSEFSQLLDSEQPISADLIILDIMLPDGESTELMPALRKQFAGPIVAHTALSGQNKIEYFKSLGFNEVLVKPTTLESFTQTIGMVLEGGASGSQ